MKPTIRHARLDAFFNAKILNALMIVVIISVLVLDYTGFMLLPAVCGGVALVLFLGYSIWFWVKKPRRVTVSKLIADVNGSLTLYFLIVTAIKDPGPWWFIFPCVAAVVLLFIDLLRPTDQTVEL